MASSVTEMNSSFLILEVFNICCYVSFNKVQRAFFILWHISIPEKTVFESLSAFTSISCKD